MDGVRGVIACGRERHAGSRMTKCGSDEATVASIT